MMNPILIDIKEKLTLKSRKSIDANIMLDFSNKHHLMIIFYMKRIQVILQNNHI